MSTCGTPSPCGPTSTVPNRHVSPWFPGLSRAGAASGLRCSTAEFGPRDSLVPMATGVDDWGATRPGGRVVGTNSM
jgi:hypothetical protein